MLKRFTVSFDVFDLHGTLIERGHREVFADTAMGAKNRIAKDYAWKPTWGHIKIKNFKIDKFVPVETPVKPTIPKFLIEYDLVFKVKDPSGGWRYGITGYPVAHKSHEKQIITAINQSQAIKQVSDHWKKINPSSMMARIKVTEIDTAKKGRKRKK